MGIKATARTVPHKGSPKNRAGKRGDRAGPSNLADALFSGTQQRVLALLFGQPDRSYFATELIDLVRSGSGAVQRELRRLEESGLVKVKRLGNQKHFQANASAPIYAELRSILLKTVALTEPLSAALEPLKPRLKLAVLYGSIAKGTDTAFSDVDLLVVADGLTLEEIYAAMAPAERDIARQINPTLYTAREFERRRNASDSFVSKVLKGEHIVLAGNEHGVAATR